MKVVYVAGPFRALNPDGTWNGWQQEENIRSAERLALQVWRLGAAALCPHTNTRFFQGAADDSVWLDGDLELLRRCDAILMTPDWQRSTGAIAEHAFADSKQIPRFYTVEALKVWLESNESRLFDTFVTREATATA